MEVVTAQRDGSPLFCCRESLIAWLTCSVRQNMKKLLSVLIIAALAFAGCNYSDREVSVKDVTKNETIILRKRPSQGWISSISGIHIAGGGSIEGKAEVHLILNGEVHKKGSGQREHQF